jgi:uroporphyrinogen decarboxylase
MNKKERVNAVLKGEIPDKIPKGEFTVGKELAKKITGLDGFNAKLKTADRLNFDFIAPQVKYELKYTGKNDKRGKKIFIDPWGRYLTFYDNCPVFCESPCKCIEELLTIKLPSLEYFNFSNIISWKDNSDLYIFALIDGIFQTLSSLLEFNEFLIATVRNKEELIISAERIADFIKKIMDKAIAAGADGIIIGEDIAFNEGTFISPISLEEVFFPVLKKVISEINVPVIFHSDGNLNPILDSIVNLNISGIQSLQSSSGMDLGKLKKQYGNKITLIGNMDLDDLQRTPEDKISNLVKNIIQQGAPGGRYMFSSSSGILDDSLPINKVLLAYDVVEDAGNYLNFES